MKTTASPMTSRERVLRAMRRQIPDRVPFDLSWGLTPAAYDLFKSKTGQTSPEEYFGVDVRVLGGGPTKVVSDYSRYFKNLPAGATIDEWGIGHQPTDSQDKAHSHLEGFIYPMLDLKTEKDAEDYPLPDIDAAYRYDWMPACVKEMQGRGLAVCGGMACTIFEIAWYMRSMELLMMDFIDNPEFASVFLDRITEKREGQARLMVESGVDVLMLGDDVASQRSMMMSLPMWRKWLKGRLGRVIKAARSVRPDILIFYHSDGNILPIVDDLIEIGVDILNPIQCECVDPADLKKKYGDRLSFWGTIGTQTTLPFGTPDDVRREVKLRMETVGKGGGLLLGPTHFVEPEVPWENLTAFVEAVKEFGVYE